MDIAADTDDEHFVIENDTNYNTQIDGSFIHIMLCRLLIRHSLRFLPIKQWNGKKPVSTVFSR